MLPVFSRECLLYGLLLLLELHGVCSSENNRGLLLSFLLSFAMCYYLTCPQQESERFS